MYEVMPMLGRLFEVHALRRTAVALLETYLGHHTGKRVLNGLVKRGDGEHIDAVIWFCDFRDSTVLSGSLPREEYLEQLNRFFYCMAGAVLKKGGEVLKYIGDAVLAIFPTASGAEDACRRALQAAALAAERVAAANGEHPDAPPMRFGIGLHVGTVTYGNVGVPQRLDFTVIGNAVNVASRLEALAKDKGFQIMVSREVVRQARWEPSSEFTTSVEVRGVAAPVDVIGFPRGRDLPASILAAVDDEEQRAMAAGHAAARKGRS